MVAIGHQILARRAPWDDAVGRRGSASGVAWLEEALQCSNVVNDACGAPTLRRCPAVGTRAS
jgi:hypothetical protein